MTIAPDPLLDSKSPTGPIENRWDQHKFDMKLVNPNNKRKFDDHRGRAPAWPAPRPPPRMAELGYRVKVFTFHDSPRRAHSIAAQGGINAAKNYQNDGDSVYRLFYDTVKGGDFRSRESNVYRLAQVSVEHHRPVRRPGRALRPRVRRPARQPLVRRRPGEPHLLRPGPDRPAAPARRLPGARRSRSRWAPSSCYTQVRDARRGRRRTGPRVGIVVRDLVTGEVSSHSGHAVVLATGGYGNAFYLSTNAMNCNVTAAWRAHKKGALFANPCYTQIHPTCIPAERRVPVEAHADVRVAAQRRAHLGAQGRRRRPPRRADPRGRARLLPRAQVPGLRQPGAPRRRLPQRQDRGRRGPGRRPAEERRLPRLRRRHRPARRRRGRASATATSSRCTSASPARTPTRCRCASTRPSTTRWAGSGSTTTS